VGRIIGIDPGLAAAGWGVLDCEGSKIHCRGHGCIETSAETPRGERLFFIYTEFCRVLDEFRPQEGAMETLYYGRNISSALAVAEARGVLSMALAQRGIPLREFTPNGIKKAVAGVASADKAQVQEMVRFLLALPELPRPDHAADALAAAVCGANNPAGLLGLKTRGR